MNFKKELDKKEAMFNSIKPGNVLVFEQWNIDSDYTKYTGIAVGKKLKPIKKGECEIWSCQVEGYEQPFRVTWPMLISVTPS